MNSALKIVRVIPYPYPAVQFGGPVLQSHAVCCELARRGHQVKVVTSDMGIADDVPRECWVEQSGYQVWHMKSTWFSRQPPYLLRGANRPLSEALRDADILQLNVGLTLLNDSARFWAQREQVPYVYNAEGALCSKRMKIKYLRKLAFRHWVEQGIVLQAAACQAVSQYEAETLRSWHVPAEKIHVIPNGIVLPEPAAVAERQTARAHFGYGDDECVFLFLGRLDRLKGVDLLLDAFRRLAGDHPSARLLIAGPDFGWEANLRRDVAAAKLEHQVQFAGTLHDQAKRQAFRAADVFALNSHSEGLPNAVIEGLGYGLPMVLSPDCNLPEVADFDAGLITPLDVSQIEIALRRMATDDVERSEFSRNARRLAAERFEIRTVVDQLELLYRHVIEQAAMCGDLPIKSSATDAGTKVNASCSVSD
ncbi:glycosyltransferase [Blastopirellula sp. J2-11]|uniref:glycosyltransferase n=1 Tax=Blastopirellula sp. J2-11 TaxID=2943192 RepID=UPI0021C72A41|nr:glycosyltransferase [Blastopirellula sp. J2-11]UUO04588.1 glycosyltransferase [Blastopirellula sp. J2-11]